MGKKKKDVGNELIGYHVPENLGWVGVYMLAQAQ